MKSYQEAIELIKTHKNMLESILSNYKEDDTSIMIEDMRADINALNRTVKLLESENEMQEDADAHCWSELSKEMGEKNTEKLLPRMITLAEWAKRNGLDESYVRQKARRGSLKTACKIGRDWFISEAEENTDNRKKAATK